MNARRMYVLAWLLSALGSIGASLLVDRASWPRIAREYEQWFLYSAPWPYLPLATAVFPVGAAMLLAAAGLLWWNVSGGRVVLLAGLLLHAYETYSTIPVLQSGAESIAAALFYFASGALFAAPALDRARVRNTDLRTRPSLDHDPQD